MRWSTPILWQLPTIPSATVFSLSQEMHLTSLSRFPVNPSRVYFCFWKQTSFEVQFSCLFYYCCLLKFSDLNWKRTTQKCRLTSSNVWNRSFDQISAHDYLIFRQTVLSTPRGYISAFYARRKKDCTCRKWRKVKKCKRSITSFHFSVFD